MAIDLGALTGTAKNAGPKTKTTSDKTDADFSRTLAASRHARAHAAGPARTAEARQPPDPDPASPAGREHSTPHETARPELPHSESAADIAKAAADGSGKGKDHHDLARRRLTRVSLIAERLKMPAGRTPRSAATASQTHVTTSDGRAAALPAKVKGKANTDTQPDEVRSDKTSARNDRDTRPADSADRDTKDTHTPDPVAALIQPPLIAAGVIKSNGTSQTAVDDTTAGGSSSHSGGLQLSWRQLFARLDGDARNGQSNSQSNSQTGGHAADGNDPAQLLAALTAGKSGTRVDGVADHSMRFGILHGAGHTDAGQNNSLLTSSAGHAPNTSATAPTAGAGSAAGTAVPTTLSAPLASDDWNNALGQQTLRLAGSGQNQAQIQLHPRELGQINISITVNDHNQAQVHFAAAHAHVRDAVEAALPQLRQSLAAGGLSLGQTSVGDHNSQGAFANDGGQSGRRDRNASGDLTPVTDAVVDAGSITSISRGSGQAGGIDIFA